MLTGVSVKGVKVLKATGKTPFMGKVRLKIKFIGFEEGDKSVEVEEGKTYSDLMLSLGINPETVIVLRDSLPVPLDEKVEDGEITVMRVISGG